MTVGCVFFTQLVHILIKNRVYVDECENTQQPSDRYQLGDKLQKARSFYKLRNFAKLTKNSLAFMGLFRAPTKVDPG